MALIEALASGLCASSGRADAVFGKQRTEEERQARMEDRINGKLVRRQFTDAIKDYLDRNAITGNRAQWMYVHASDTLNRLLFGLTAKKLCEKYKCPKEALRNQFSREDIVNIRRMEEHSMRLVDRANIDPIDALGEAYRFWFAN